MSDLTDFHSALKLVQSLLPKSTDTLTRRATSVSRTAKTTVSAYTDTALTLPPRQCTVSAPSVRTLTVTNSVPDEKNTHSVSASVHFEEKHPHQPELEPAPSTCPTHWLRVPELPLNPPRVDEDGLGCLYRHQAGGVWYLIKYLPPFDGRVSVMNSHHEVRVLPSLDEALRVLELITPR